MTRLVIGIGVALTGLRRIGIGGLPALNVDDARNTRAVARFTLANSPSPTQPLNNNTVSERGLDSIGVSVRV